MILKSFISSSHFLLDIYSIELLEFECWLLGKSKNLSNPLIEKAFNPIVVIFWIENEQTLMKHTKRQCVKANFILQINTLVSKENIFPVLIILKFWNVFHLLSRTNRKTIFWMMSLSICLKIKWSHNLNMIKIKKQGFHCTQSPSSNTLATCII